MGATTIVTRAGKGSALTHNELDTDLNNLNNVGIGIGFVLMWPLSATPDSTWLECDGSSKATASYPLLFSKIGYSYGGSGANFNLPDYRGVFLRGWDHGAGEDPDASSRTDRGDGTVGDNVGTWQIDAFKSHTHNIDKAPSSNNSSGNYVTPANTPGALQATQATGGSETRPVNINIMFVIKATLG